MVEAVIIGLAIIFIIFICSKSSKNDVRASSLNDNRVEKKSFPEPPSCSIQPFKIRLSNAPAPSTAKSKTGAADQYSIDLSAQTCACPDFVETRSEFPHGDPRRFCKHMVNAVVNCGVLEKSPAILDLVFRNAYEMQKGLARDRLYYAEIDGSPIIVSRPESGEWVNVYCRNRVPKKDGTYSFKRFGFNLGEQRWSYGYGPPGAKILRQLFSDWT